VCDEAEMVEFCCVEVPMIAVPTTTVSILGGNTSSDFGDVLDSETVATSGIPASIVEGRQVVATESDPQARIIRYYTGRLPNGTVVNDSQRIRDEVTGEIYSIDNVTRPRNPVIPQDVRLDLRRVE
jgi:hypothetical protein